MNYRPFCNNCFSKDLRKNNKGIQKICKLCGNKQKDDSYFNYLEKKYVDNKISGKKIKIEISEETFNFIKDFLKQRKEFNLKNPEGYAIIKAFKEITDNLKEKEEEYV